MTLTKFKPSKSLLSDTFFPTGIDRFFNDLMYDVPVTEHVHTPKAEVVETETSFKVNVVMAGMDKEDINIDAKDNELIISGQHKEEKEEKKERYHIKEFSMGKFRRSFYMPDSANMEDIQASLKNGILEIVVPKREKAVAKAIEIK